MQLAIAKLISSLLIIDWLILFLTDKFVQYSSDNTEIAVPLISCKGVLTAKYVVVISLMFFIKN